MKVSQFKHYNELSLLLNTERSAPRCYRFPIPNAVWRYRLKPIEFVIFSYLCYHNARSQADTSAIKAVAANVHLTTSTVRKYLDALTNKGVISAKWSIAPQLQCANGKKFFTLPNEIFLLKVPHSAFVVYAYLLLIEDRRTHTCHPSYNTIAAETGISKNTALKSVSVLLEKQLITVEPSWYFDKHGMKWKGNNLYSVLPVKIATEEFYRQQFQQMEIDAERRRVRKKQKNSPATRPGAAL